MSAIGGLLSPLKPSSRRSLLLDLCGHDPSAAEVCVNAPIAPGFYTDIHVRQHRHVKLGQTVYWQGPGVLAFDGERERVLGPGQGVRLKVTRNGPRVVRISKVMLLAAANRAFCR